MHANDPTSLSLLDRLSGRQPDAWMRFTQLYGPLVVGWCRRGGLNAEDAEDVCQDVFRSVARSIGAFTHAGPHGSFRGWLRAVTRNCLHQHHRRSARQPVAVGGSDAYQRLEAVADLPDDPDQEATETTELVRRALGLIWLEFTEQTWEAFRRVTFDGVSPADVGQALGMSAFAVRQAAYRVRRRLRAELGEPTEVPEPTEA